MLGRCQLHCCFSLASKQAPRTADSVGMGKHLLAMLPRDHHLVIPHLLVRAQSEVLCPLFLWLCETSFQSIAQAGPKLNFFFFFFFSVSLSGECQDA